MSADSVVVQVFDHEDKKLYEGESKERATEYGYRLLMLGTHDLLHIRESSSRGRRRSILTREQAHRWYNRKHDFDDLNWGTTQPAPKPVAAVTMKHKLRARRFANAITITISFLILVAALHAMNNIFH